MATPKQTDPQFKLRLTPELRDQIEASAETHNRSMNAEIVARLEDYPRINLLETAFQRSDQVEKQLRDEIDQLRLELRQALARATMYEKKLMVADHDRPRLEKQVAHYQRINEDLTRLIQDAAKREIDADEDRRLSGMIEAMQDELEALSRERGDIKSETDRLLEAQQQAISRLERTVGITSGLLEVFRDAFLEGKEDPEEAILEVIRKSPLGRRPLQPTPEEWSELRAAPTERQPEILEALANGDVATALKAARLKKKKSAA